jgi:hypothetical protein
MSPAYNSRCADCGLDTIAEGEWYMVKDEIWERAGMGPHRALRSGPADPVHRLP